VYNPERTNLAQFSKWVYNFFFFLFFFFLSVYEFCAILNTRKKKTDKIIYYEIALATSLACAKFLILQPLGEKKNIHVYKNVQY